MQTVFGQFPPAFPPPFSESGDHIGDGRTVSMPIPCLLERPARIGKRRQQMLHSRYPHLRIRADAVNACAEQGIPVRVDKPPVRAVELGPEKSGGRKLPVLPSSVPADWRAGIVHSLPGEVKLPVQRRGHFLGGTGFVRPLLPGELSELIHIWMGFIRKLRLRMGQTQPQNFESPGCNRRDCTDRESPDPAPVHEGIPSEDGLQHTGITIQKELFTVQRLKRQT
ncbi:hypothetical protein D3C81_421910 [compost metagenome]